MFLSFALLVFMVLACIYPSIRFGLARRALSHIVDIHFF